MQPTPLRLVLSALPPLPGRPPCRRHALAVAVIAAAMGVAPAARAFDAVIELSGLDGSNGFALNGIAVGDFSGVAVAGAGDVNGDGFDDLIVGAYGADPNGHLSGQSYVVFGASGGFAASLEFSALDGNNGFTLNGIAGGDFLGHSVAGAGDVNGDGFDDLIVGAWGASPNGDRSGQSYVVFGASGGFAASLDLSGLNGSNGFALNGIAAGDSSGRAVAGAGDINGDGFDDLVVGAPIAGPRGFGSGQSYVVFGASGGFAATLELSALDGNNGFTLNGVAAEDRSGYAVAGAGDVNGDGFDDLIIGASGADPNGSGSGQSYLVFGKSDGFAASLDLSALDGSNGFALNGVSADDDSGLAVAGAGDFNGDGFDDLVVGAPLADPRGFGSGQSYVVFGARGGFAASLDLSTLNGSNGFALNGSAGGDYSGFAVAGAGDVNGDGFDDLIVGAFGADSNGHGSGQSYVVYGKDSAFGPVLDLSALDGGNGFTLNGIAAFDDSGVAVAGSGDFNGDGADDLIIGAWRSDPNGDYSGQSYLVFGGLPEPVPVPAPLALIAPALGWLGWRRRWRG